MRPCENPNALTLLRPALIGRFHCSAKSMDRGFAARQRLLTLLTNRVIRCHNRGAVLEGG
jgi:hypothetical protein